MQQVCGRIHRSSPDEHDRRNRRQGRRSDNLKLRRTHRSLSEAKSKKLEDAGYIGKVVTLGIRPEDLHDEESYLAMSPKSVFEATVRVYEMLGSEVLLYFDIEDANFVAKVNPRTTARPGDTIKLAMDLEKIHIFDKDTELVVLN